MTQAGDMLALVVASVTPLTPAIKAFVLRGANGAPLPAFTPGAHLGVQVMQPNGHAGQRAYSLARPHGDADSYEIAVLHEPQGAGGSAWMHGLKEGAMLSAHAPRNDFALHRGEAAPLLVAGGIGITPLLCMARALAAEGRAFEFVYATRSAQATAYLREVRALGGTLVHDGGDPSRGLDLRALLSAPAPGRTCTSAARAAWCRPWSTRPARSAGPMRTCTSNSLPARSSRPATPPSRCAPCAPARR